MADALARVQMAVAHAHRQMICDDTMARMIRGDLACMVSECIDPAILLATA